jgi:predicted ATP-grasp superfamily ATP-dependent carboligase
VAHGALVLDLDTRAGLAISRSLGRQGVIVGVASPDARASGMRTRYAVRRLVLPPPEDGIDAHARALLEYLEEQPTDAVLPSVDASVEALLRHRAEFERVTAPALASSAAVELASSKPRTLELAASLGISTPASLEVGSPAELADAVAELGLPAVLKPATSWRDLPGGGGERLGPVLLLNEDDVAREGAALGRALLQEVVPGARETVKLFRSDGRTLAVVVMRTDRSWPPLGGSSVMRRTIAAPEDVVGAAERLVAEVGLDGYAEVEFRRDSHGRPVLMEVNPRLSQSIEVAARAGVDFARMQLEWARGGRVEPVSRYAVGVRVGWLAGDARLLAAALLGTGPPPRPSRWQTAQAIAGDYVVRRARIDGFALRDPAPMLAALVFTGRGALRPSPSPG